MSARKHRPRAIRGDATPPASPTRPATANRDAPLPGRILAALDATPRAADAVASLAGCGLDEALAALLELEWSGLAVAWPRARWARAGREAHGRR